MVQARNLPDVLEQGWITEQAEHWPTKQETPPELYAAATTALAYEVTKDYGSVEQGWSECTLRGTDGQRYTLSVVYVPHDWKRDTPEENTVRVKPLDSDWSDGDYYEDCCDWQDGAFRDESGVEHIAEVLAADSTHVNIILRRVRERAIIAWLWAMKRRDMR